MVDRVFSGAPWEAAVGYCRAHREFFGDHPPATTMVEVQALIEPEMLIEIEMDAVCAPGSESG